MTGLGKYHRNGICGLGFEVGIAEGALCVEFREFISEKQVDGVWEEEYKHHRVAVNLDLLVELDADGHEQVKCVSNCEGSAWLIRGNISEHEGTFIALHAPHAPEAATAVLKVDLLPSVTFGINSWRGDHWHDCISELHTNASFWDDGPV